MLHLCGNVRQWIGFGVAGKPDIRVRDREFSARGGISREELKERLAAVIAEATVALRTLPHTRLNQTTVIQGHEVTVLVAIYQVIEHFSGHTGQIIFIAKAMTDKDFGFYSYLEKKHSEKLP